MTPGNPLPQRFTFDGGPALEAHLAALCERARLAVAAVIPNSRRLGILLGGGYGRGEGGVLRDPADGSEHPYNDLEFYVFVRGSSLLAERAFGPALHEAGERLGPGTGLEFEFKVLSTAKLRRSPPSMFLYDLVVGHRVVEGEAGQLLRGCDHHRNPAAIPLHEATRLLLNRASGLLFAAEQLGRSVFGAAEADFVGRNLAKAQLALGDVVLTAFGLYQGRCAERGRRLEGSLPREADTLPLGALRRHHAEGVRFKFHPARSTATREDLAGRHAELVALAGGVWLWLEGRRLGRPFPSPLAYALAPGDLRPETPAWRNRLINARAFGPAAGLAAAGARHPRERLLRSLPLLLFTPHDHLDDALRTRLGEWLGSGATDLPGQVAAYRRLWARFA